MLKPHKNVTVRSGNLKLEFAVIKIQLCCWYKSRRDSDFFV